MRFVFAALLALFTALPAAAQVAVNPITNRVYIANRAENTVTVLDGATGMALATLPVPGGPLFIAANPINNRIYVNAANDASLAVIDGATNAVQSYAIGSTGPVAINPVTGKVYIVRFSSAAYDETTIFDEAARSWYSVALLGYQPVGIAVNTVSNKYLVATYASNEIRVIDGSSSSDHPPSTPVGVWSKPVAIALNPVTGRAYSLQEDDRGPIAIIAPDNTATFLTPPGHAVGPKAVAVNPVTNKIYAAFAGEVIVIDGATNAMTFIASGTVGAGPVGLGINTLTNMIYVPNANGTLTIIDGATNATSTIAIPAGATSIGVNPITNTYYVAHASGYTQIDGSAGDSRQANPIVTTITPLPSDTGGSNVTLTLDASSSFAPNTPALLGVYYQLDSQQGPWLRAAGSGPYTASFTGLAPGTHTLRAYAVDSGVAPNFNTQQQNTPLVGTIASYTFTVNDTPAPTPATVAFAQASYSVTEGGPQVQATVNRTDGSTQAVTVTWTTSNGTAAAGSDFGSSGNTTQLTGTLSWAAGDTAAKVITIGAGGLVPVIDDAANEPAEAFTLTLSNPSSGAQLGTTAAATVNVADNDTAPPVTTTFRFGTATLTVSETGPNVTLEVIREGPTTGAASVTYQTADGTAMQRSDYSATTGVLDFAPGVTSRTIAIGATRATAPYILVANDGVTEPEETFSVNLLSPSGGALGSPASSTITIVGAAPAPSVVQFSSATAAVSEGAGSLSLTIVRSGTASEAASVNWSTSNGTAIAGTDFGTSGVPTQLSGTVSWAAGESAAKVVSIPIINDNAIEGAKVFTVELSGASGTSLGTASTSSVTINDDDAGVALSGTAYSVGEAEGLVTITVNRTGDPRAAASVRWSTANGTAVAGRDYGTAGTSTPPSGLVSWRAGDSTAKTFVVRIINDALAEGDLQFTVTLSTPSGTTVAVPDTATVTIIDDDAPAESTFSLSAPKYLVMESGGQVTITVNRTALSGGGFSRPATVAYTPTNGTAVSGSDFTLTTGTLSWGAGESGSKSFTIPIVNDGIAESTELFGVRLQSPSGGATITTAEAAVAIVDDDEVFPLDGAFPEGWTVPSGAANGWVVSNEAGAFEGAYSLKSEPVLDNESAQVEFTRAFAAGSVAFRFRISSEPGFDFLRFYVDGVKVGEWSGAANPAWQAFTTPITAGTHTLRWSYEKDASASVGADAAWIDALTVPGAP